MAVPAHGDGLSIDKNYRMIERERGRDLEQLHLLTGAR